MSALDARLHRIEALLLEAVEILRTLHPSVRGHHTHRWGGWGIETDGTYQRYCQDTDCKSYEMIRLTGDGTTEGADPDDAA